MEGDNEDSEDKPNPNPELPRPRNQAPSPYRTTLRFSTRWHHEPRELSCAFLCEPQILANMTRIRNSGAMPSLLSWILLSLYALPSYALHFYMHGGTPKCFVEELPKDTLVVGTWQI